MIGGRGDWRKNQEAPSLGPPFSKPGAPIATALVGVVAALRHSRRKKELLMNRRANQPGSTVVTFAAVMPVLQYCFQLTLMNGFKTEPAVGKPYSTLGFMVRGYQERVV